LKLSGKKATQLLEVKKVKVGDKGYKYVSEFVTIAEVEVNQEDIDNVNEKKASSDVATDSELSFWTNSLSKVKELFGFSSTAYADTATDQQTTSKWVGNVKGYVSVYYHQDSLPGLEDSIDMNYIQTWWTAGTGSFVSNRKAVMEQRGKSHWGDHLNSTEIKTVYPSSNAVQKFDVPDAWYPVFEGFVGASSSSTAVINGSSYSLSVVNKVR